MNHTSLGESLDPPDVPESPLCEECGEFKDEGQAGDMVCRTPNCPETTVTEEEAREMAYDAWYEIRQMESKLGKARIHLRAIYNAAPKSLPYDDFGVAIADAGIFLKSLEKKTSPPNENRPGAAPSSPGRSGEKG